MGLGGKKRREFTEKEIGQLEAFGVIKLPTEHIASIFGIDHETFQRMLQKNSKARDLLLEGRAKGSSKFRDTLYQKAVFEKDVQAMKFWGATQEGMVIQQSMTLSGPDGQPIQIRMSDDELNRQIQRLQKKASGE